MIYTVTRDRTKLSIRLTPTLFEYHKVLRTKFGRHLPLKNAIRCLIKHFLQISSLNKFYFDKSFFSYQKFSKFNHRSKCNSARQPKKYSISSFLKSCGKPLCWQGRQLVWLSAGALSMFWYGVRLPCSLRVYLLISIELSECNGPSAFMVAIDYSRFNGNHNLHEKMTNHESSQISYCTLRTNLIKFWIRDSQ